MTQEREKWAQSYDNLERHNRENVEYYQILQKKLELVSQKLSEQEKARLETDLTADLEASIASSSSMGNTTGTTSAPAVGSADSPDHRPLRGRPMDDGLDHTVDGFSIVHNIM